MPAMSAQLTINPETLLLDGAPRDLLTAGEFAELAPPACPVCATTVEVQRLDATPNADYEAEHGRGYLVGMWSCPHGCDPRTGQRMHYGQEYGTSPGAEGATCACTCGDTTVVLGHAEAAAWQAVHRRTATGGA
jgi:hypothetical protein